MNEVFYNDQQINDLLEELISQIKGSGRQFTAVVGIREGGVNLSKKVAKALNLPHYSVRISHYDDTEFRPTPLVEASGFHVSIFEACLIIDDLVDGGSTITTFKKWFGLREQDAVAVLFWKPNKVYKPDFFTRLKGEAWIKFPWGIDDE